jgi:recombinational DNA repair ATPase RecF
MVVEPHSARVFVGTRILREKNELIKDLMVILKIKSKEKILEMAVDDLLKTHGAELMREEMRRLEALQKQQAEQEKETTPNPPSAAPAVRG